MTLFFSGSTVASAAEYSLNILPTLDSIGKKLTLKFTFQVDGKDDSPFAGLSEEDFNDFSEYSYIEYALAQSDINGTEGGTGRMLESKTSIFTEDSITAEFEDEAVFEEGYYLTKGFDLRINSDAFKALPEAEQEAFFYKHLDILAKFFDTYASSNRQPLLIHITKPEEKPIDPPDEKPDETSDRNNGGGGCNVGFLALVLMILPLSIQKEKNKK
ncbi:MAG: SYNERG-CTERM sorting domain-containing protein [Puniceicoccales bacterium]|nr:SYNERG-CTERM sorting domain-containing protein [Puniceicoccales bacterium]